MPRAKKAKGDTLATCEPGDVVRLSIDGQERLVRVTYRLQGEAWLARTVDVQETRIIDTSEPFVLEDSTPFHGRELGREWHAARNSSQEGKETDPLKVFH